MPNLELQLTGVTMKRFLLGLLLLPLLSGSALAQGAMNCKVNAADPSGYQDGQTQPCSQDTNGHIRTLTTATIGVVPLTTTQAKITIAVTGTYQQALPSTVGRKGCTVQYIAVAGTKGFVFLGAAPPNTTTSFQLTNGQSLNCAVGGLGVASDAINVTATTNDIFIVSNQ